MYWGRHPVSNIAVSGRPPADYGGDPTRESLRFDVPHEPPIEAATSDATGNRHHQSLSVRLPGQARTQQLCRRDAIRCGEPATQRVERLTRTGPILAGSQSSELSVRPKIIQLRTLVKTTGCRLLIFAASRQAPFTSFIEVNYHHHQLAFIICSFSRSASVHSSLNCASTPCLMRCPLRFVSSKCPISKRPGSTPQPVVRLRGSSHPEST